MERSDVNYDWLIVQYNKSGVKKWSATFDDAYHSSDIPVGLAIDKKGNTHVTGYVYIPGGYAIGTVHYSKTGALLDSDIYKRGNNFNGFAIGIGVDKNDNVYTAGTIGPRVSPYPTSIVIKYSVAQNIIAENVVQSKFENDLKLFPNPVNNNLNIQFTNSASGVNYNIAIRDMNGNIFFSKQINSADKTLSLNVDVQNLKQGIYTATISDGINTVSKTFLKQ